MWGQESLRGLQTIVSAPAVMKGCDVMPDRTELSEAKRALLEKYLRGDIRESLPQNATAASIQGSLAPLSFTGSRAPLVPVQSGGSKRPFFFLHVHWHGGAFYCFTLARDLGTDQPFYVLEPYRFDDLPVPPTFEAMAAAHIKSLREFQHEGPYLLAGWCNGGLVAYEMARQLRAEGQEVDLLALLDPWAGPIQVIRLVGGFIRRIGNLIRLSSDKQLDWFLRLRHMYRLLWRSQDEDSQPFSLFPSVKALRQDWMGIFIWAVSDYLPQKYPGKVTYFWASEQPGDRRMWWGKVSKTEDEKEKEVEIHIISGKHMTLVTEHLHVVTERLRTCLSKA